MMKPGTSARINRIKIQNIKSFREAEICFNDGVTVICGENGVGKSTIFEALGYCLFNVEAKEFVGRKAANFIRYGHSTGQVEVEYTGVDGNSYKVQRNQAGKASMLIRSDDGEYSELDGFTQKKIQETLGLRSTVGLEKQFVDIIGPLQAEFSAPFTRSETERLKHFNEILGINRWRDAYEKTSTWENTIRSKMQVLEKEIEGKESLIFDLPELKAEHKSKTSEIDKITAQIQELEEKLASLKAEEQRLKDLWKTIQDMERDIERSQLKAESCGQKLASLKEQLDKARESHNLVEQHRPARVAYVAANKSIEIQEERRRQRDVLEKEKNTLERKIEAGKSSLVQREKRVITDQEEYRERLTELAAELEKANESRHSLVETISQAHERLKTLEERKEAVDREIKKAEIVKRSEEEIRYKSATLQALRKKINEATEQVTSLPQIQEETQQVTILESKKNSLNKEIAVRERDIEEKEAGKKLLKEGKCPYFKDTCKNLADKNAGEFFDIQITTLQKEIVTLAGELKVTESTLLKAREAQKKVIVLQQVQKSLEQDRFAARDIVAAIRGVISPEEIKEIFTCFKESLGHIFLDDVSADLHQLKEKSDNISFIDDVNEWLEVLSNFYREFSKTGVKVKDVVKKLLKEQELSARMQEQKLAKTDTEIKNLHKEQDQMNKKVRALEDESKSLESEKKQLENEENRLHEMVSSINENYSGIDEELFGYTSSRRDNEEGNRIFLQHQKDAERVPFLENDTQKEENEINRLTDTISHQKIKHMELLQNFSEEALKEASFLVTKTEQDCKVLQVEAKNYKERLTWLQQSIEKMEAIVLRIKSLEKEKREWEKTRKLAKFLRDSVFREIEPRVSEVLRFSISEIAREIYRIVSGGNEELSWEDKYSVRLTDIVEGKRRERTDKQLSGGQFMSAVIALRLALLQTVGSPFAFFDEPTSHLDEDRRKNLAEAFRTLNKEGKRWYRQLFLVSHDESFQGISGNVIELELDEHRCTRVMTPVAMREEYYYIRASVK